MSFDLILKNGRIIDGTIVVEKGIQNEELPGKVLQYKGWGVENG